MLDRKLFIISSADCSAADNSANDFCKASFSLRKASVALSSMAFTSALYATRFLIAAVSAAPAAYKAAAASTAAQKVDILATLALGSGTVTDTNEDGMIVTATMGGAAGTGTIEVTIKYVVD